MWPDRVSNPGPLTFASCALPTALGVPAIHNDIWPLLHSGNSIITMIMTIMLTHGFVNIGTVLCHNFQ